MKCQTIQPHFYYNKSVTYYKALNRGSEMESFILIYYR